MSYGEDAEVALITSKIEARVAEAAAAPEQRDAPLYTAVLAGDVAAAEAAIVSARMAPEVINFSDNAGEARGCCRRTCVVLLTPLWEQAARLRCMRRRGLDRPRW